MNEHERFLPIAEMLKRYGVSRLTISRWVAAGELPEPVRLNNLRYWRLSDLEEFERNRIGKRAYNAPPPTSPRKAAS